VDERVDRNDVTHLTDVVEHVAELSRDVSSFDELLDPPDECPRLDAVVGCCRAM
jgi:hypothetical protein